MSQCHLQAAGCSDSHSEEEIDRSSALLSSVEVLSTDPLLQQSPTQQSRPDQNFFSSGTQEVSILLNYIASQQQRQQQETPPLGFSSLQRPQQQRHRSKFSRCTSDNLLILRTPIRSTNDETPRKMTTFSYVRHTPAASNASKKSGGAFRKLLLCSWFTLWWITSCLVAKLILLSTTTSLTSQVVRADDQEWLSQQMRQKKQQEKSATPHPPGEYQGRGTAGRRRHLLQQSLHQHLVQHLTDLDEKHDEDEEKETAANESDAKPTTPQWQALMDHAQTLYRQYNQHEVVRSNIYKLPDRVHALQQAFPPFPESLRQAELQRLRNMFQESYDSYMQFGYPEAEIRPLSCRGGEFDLIRLQALTLIDALDTLVILGNFTEFARSVERLRVLHAEQHLFAVDQNVSLFETNIRVLGGLLSAHQMAVAYMKGNDSDGRVWEHEVFDKGGDVRWGSPLDPQEYVIDYYDSDDEEDDALDFDEIFTQRDGEPHSRLLDHYRTILLSSSSCPREGSMYDPHCQAPASQHPEPGDPDSLFANYDRMCWTAQAPELTFLFLQREGSDYRHYHQKHMLHPPLSLSMLQQSGSPQQRKAAQNRTRTFKQWDYDGFLLELAQDLGERFLPAFATRTGIPYGTVNMLIGVPEGETTIASLAGGGTLCLEMELLSRLTGDERYGRSAKLASRGLFMRKSPLALFGKHIDVSFGHWTETLSGIGSNSDSFYEYLLKHYLLFPEDEDFWVMLLSVYAGILNHSRAGEWYVDVDMNHGSGLNEGGSKSTGGQSTGGGTARRVLESLMAFFPGMQVLLGQLVPAARSLNSFMMVREWLGFLPERFHFATWRVDAGRGAAKHPLRPELLESAYFVHLATHGLINYYNKDKSRQQTFNSGWLWAVTFAIDKIESITKSECGYASVKDLVPQITGTTELSGVATNMAQAEHLFDEMPSFFLSETIKYLYLALDTDNILHRDDERHWIFTTEAHPIHSIAKVQDAENSAGDRPSHMNSQVRRFRTLLTERTLQKQYDRMMDARNSPQQQEAQRSATLGARLLQALNSLRDRRTDRSKERLLREKWTDKSPMSGFQHTLNAVNASIAPFRELHQKHREARMESIYTEEEVEYVKSNVLYYFMHFGLIRPFSAEDDDLNATFGKIGNKDSRQHENLAHLAFENGGQGTMLHRSCPNFYSSDLVWLQALNGGAVDYSSLYVTVSRDAIMHHPNYFEVLGSAEALGMHGSGVMSLFHDSNHNPDEADEACELEPPLEQQHVHDEELGPSEGWTASTSGHTTTKHYYYATHYGSRQNPITREQHPSSRTATAEHMVDENNNNIIRIGSDIGAFHVSPFPQGDGFYIEHVDSGETLVSTFLRGGDMTSQEAEFVMTYAAIPVDKPPRQPVVDEEDEMQGGSGVEGYMATHHGHVRHHHHGQPLVRQGKRSASAQPEPEVVEEPEPDEDLEDDTERKVVIADFHGNSFSCEVQVVELYKKERKPFARGNRDSREDAELRLDDEDHVNTQEAAPEQVGEHEEPHTAEQGEEGEDDDDMEEILLARYPCAPAMFGPSYVPNLVKTDGIRVQATAEPPPIGDEFGCAGTEMSGTKRVFRGLGVGDDGEIQFISFESKAEESAQEDSGAADDEEGLDVSASGDADGDGDDQQESPSQPLIQILRRGDCSFYSKVINQRKNHKFDEITDDPVIVEGVIIINTEETEVFVMSAGEEDDVAESEGVPTTVLVTRLDGEDLLTKLTIDADEKDTQVVARIHISRQIMAMDRRNNQQTTTSSDEADDSSAPAESEGEEPTTTTEEDGAEEEPHPEQEQKQPESTVTVEADKVEWPVVHGAQNVFRVYAKGGWGIQANQRHANKDWQLQLLRHNANVMPPPP